MKKLKGYIVFDSDGKPMEDDEGYYIYPTKELALEQGENRKNRVKECMIVYK